MRLYELVTLIHVAAAVGLLSGSVVASPAVRAAARRARTTEEVRAYLAIGHPLLVLEPVSAVAVLASGIYLTSVASFWTLGWVQIAVACWIVNTAVAGAVVKPAIGRVAAEVAASLDGAVGSRLDGLRRSPRWARGGDVLMANDAAMLYLMSLKPGLAASLLVVVLANLLVAAARSVRSRTDRSGGVAGAVAGASG